jgi:hypothetical protein
MLAALAALLAALAEAFAGALAAGLAGALAAALVRRQLHYFVFSSSFFSLRVEGTLSTTSLARTL